MKTSLKALLLSAALALPLAGCAATDNTAGTNASINSVLEQAADEARNAGNKQGSLDLLERMYKREPTNAEAALKYATALQDAGRSTRALMVLTPFINGGKADKNAPLQVEFASVEASVGNYDQAIEAARKATAVDPQNAQGWHVLGIALDAKGDHPEAEQAFRNALQNWQGDPSPVLNNLGLNLASQGFIDEAVETLKKAVSAAPDRPEIERNLRIVLALQAQPGTHENKRVPPPPRKPGTRADNNAGQVDETKAVAVTKPAAVEKAGVEKTVAEIKPAAAAPVKEERTATAKAPVKPAKVAKAKTDPAPAKLNASDKAIAPPVKDTVKAEDAAQKEPAAEKASVIKPAVVPNGRNDT